MGQGGDNQGGASSATAMHTGYIYGCNDEDKKHIEAQECPCGCQQRLFLGSVVAAEFRKAILEETGLTCCAGIAHNKLLAKIAGEQNKPNKQTLLLPGRVNQLMKSLQAKKVPGIGHKTATRLQSLGISSCMDLHACSWQVLQQEFGSQMAASIQRLSRGEDATEVSTDNTPKSISEEDSYQNCHTMDAAKINLNVLVRNLIPRLVDNVGVPKTVRLSIRPGGQAPGVYKKESRQCSVPGKIFSNSLSAGDKAELLFGIVLELFNKLVNVKKSFEIRIFNVCLTNFEKPAEKKTMNYFLQDCKKGSLSAVCQTQTTDSGSDQGNKALTPFHDVLQPAKPAATSTQFDRVDNSLSRVYDASERSAGNINKSHLKTEPACIVDGDVEIPEDVDKEVFQCLPLDVQRELTQQWRRDKRESSQVKRESSKAGSKTVGLLKYFSKT